jgi:cell division protease FtsH
MRSNHERLDALAHTLIQHETLDEADAYRAAGLPAPAATSAESTRNLDLTPGNR